MSETQCKSHQVDESQQQMEELELKTSMERIGQKILVLSGKGGVGKSTVAANLAMSLANAGKKVGLLDVDLHGPSIQKILGLDGIRLGCEESGKITPIRLSCNLCVITLGLFLDSVKDAVIWRGPMKYNVIRQFLKDTQWGKLDYLVIDLPPGTGDEPLNTAQMVGSGASAIIVTTPQDVAISDVRRSVSFCEKLQLPVVGIIENMSGFECPHCGKSVDLFKSGGGEKLAAEMSVTFLGKIPFDPQIVESGDCGRPFVEKFAGSPAAKAFAEIVKPILNDEKIMENKNMKIAIPTAQGRLCMHFGHCEQFAILETDASAKSISKTSFITPPPHEPGLLPKWLHEQGVNAIIAGGMGQRAQELFSQNGIKVLVGAADGTPEELALAYLGGTLKAGKNVCDH